MSRPSVLSWWEMRKREPVAFLSCPICPAQLKAQLVLSSELEEVYQGTCGKCLCGLEVRIKRPGA